MSEPKSFVNGEYVSDDVVQSGGRDVGVVERETLQSIEGDLPTGDVQERLSNVATVYRHEARDIARTVAEETGYPIVDTRALVEVATSFLLNADVHREAVFESGFDTRFDRDVNYNRNIRIEHRPKGSVLVVTPGNATVPIAILATASALVTGNSVTVRPSMNACKSAMKVMEPFLKRFPASVNVVFCDAEETLVPSVLAEFDAVHYTGSSRHYPSLLESAGEAKVDVYVEGEGAGVFIVESDPERAASVFADAISRCNGSLCTTPSGILAEAGVAETFEDELAGALSALEVGDPMELDVDISREATVLNPPDGDVRLDVPGPVAIYDREREFEDTEIYGPGAWLDTWTDDREIVEYLKNRDHGLNITLFSSNEKDLLRSVEAVSSRVCLNGDPTLQSPYSPWGAMNKSGDSPGNTLMEKFVRDVIAVDGGRTDSDGTDSDRTDDDGEQRIEALVLERPGEYSLRSFDSDGYDGLLVDNHMSGVCGTDKAIHAGDLEAPYPIVPGHENVSTVLRGTATDARGKQVSEGDHVLWCGVTPCGKCEMCLEGETNNCVRQNVSGVSKSATLSPYIFGGWADRSFVPVDCQMLRIDERATDDPELILVEPMATVINVPIPDGDVLIVGGGTIGGLFAARANARTDGSVTLVASEQKRGRLEQFVDEFVFRAGPGPAKASHDVVVNATGKASVFANALDYVRPGGTVVETSVLAESRTSIDVSTIVSKSLTVHGKLAYRERDLLDAYDFVTEHASALAPLTSLYDVTEYEAALEADLKAVFDVRDWNTGTQDERGAEP